MSTTDAEGGARPPLTTRPAGGAREGRRARLRAGARDVAPALAVYAAIRLVGLLALAIYARNHDYAAFARLDTYDAPRLLRLAARGYDPLIPGYLHGRPTTSNIAFFPLYPLVVRAVAALPLVSVLAAGYLVTAVSGLVAAAGLDRFGRRLVPAANGGTRAATDAAAPRTARVGGLVVVALWATWPHGVVLAMPYTEALYVALAVWSTLALLDGRWLTAGVLCLFAGATRSLGVALAGAIALAALVAVVRAVREHRRVPWRPVAGAVLAPLGVLGYWGFLWARTGRPDAWFWVQSAEWRSGFDGGAYTLRTITSSLTQGDDLVIVVCSLVVVASIALVVALAVGRAPLAVVAYAAFAVALVLGTENYMHSKSRLLLCAFPLVLPLAWGLVRLPRPVIVGVLVVLTVVVAWYNAYVLVVWTLSP